MQQIKKQRSADSDVQITVQEIEANRMRLFLNIPSFQCNVPTQLNEFDCGVYVTKYAERVMKNLPGSRLSSIEQMLADQLEAVQTITPMEVTTERNVIRRLIDDFRRRWTKRKEEDKENRNDATVISF
mmetsp:Transcript_1557/g.2576  ORF Transcript_1557/g.2576 Transcript_1557/m.2576 type:complete len:128 (+) Transcript_1557:272-655(+)